MGEIIIDSLSKKFGKKLALDKVSLKFECGKVYGLIGKNGAGKTTLMKTICGILDGDEGSCKLEDSAVGALLEEPAAYEMLDAIQNMRIFMNCCSKADDKKIIDLLNDVGLYDHRKKVKDYSLGMKKRLGIAISMLNDPSILILDEPTSGLDIDGISETRELIRRYMLDEKNMVIISSHDTRDMVELCDEIIFIDQGKILKQVESFERDSIQLEKEYLEVIKGG